MSKQKEKFIVLDTETANSVDEPLPYDIGWAICDRSGYIYAKRSFVVAEIFLDMKDLMQSAYYANKIPQYWEDIKQGKRQIKKMWNIRRIMIDDIKNYNIKKIGAYNMAFDQKSTNNLVRYISKSWLRWWLPYGMETFCIWHMACQVLADRPTYIKFANENGLVSSAGNVQTSAESIYKYLIKNPDFAESHTGLEDVEIEVEIMAHCYRQHKKMNTNINRLCWRIPQKRYKQYIAN